MSAKDNFIGNDEKLWQARASLPLPKQTAKVLRRRKKILESQLRSQTIWEMFDPPLKPKKEIEQIRESWNQEYNLIITILDENTKAQAKIALANRKAGGGTVRRKSSYKSNQDDEEEDMV
jgi:hypothetical protein